MVGLLARTLPLEGTFTQTENNCVSRHYKNGNQTNVNVTEALHINLCLVQTLCMTTNLIKNIMLFNINICNYTCIYVLIYELHISLYMKIKA